MNFSYYKNKRIAYAVQGEGLPLVFLHGLCEDSSIWLAFVKAFPNHRIILIDLLGFGQSEVLEAASIDDMAAAVDAVLGELSISKCVLVGHSLGGYVSLAFAKKHPEKLLGLGLFHSHPYVDAPERREGRLKSIAFIEQHGHENYVKQLIPKLFAPGFSNAHQIDELLAKALMCNPLGIIGALQAMLKRADHSETLRDLSCPVWFVVGTEDSAIPKEQSLAQCTLPKVAQVNILQNVGHLGMLEAQEKIQKYMNSFIYLCRKTSLQHD